MGENRREHESTSRPHMGKQLDTDDTNIEINIEEEIKREKKH